MTKERKRKNKKSKGMVAKIVFFFIMLICVYAIGLLTGVVMGQRILFAEIRTALSGSTININTTIGLNETKLAEVAAAEASKGFNSVISNKCNIDCSNISKLNFTKEEK